MAVERANQGQGFDTARPPILQEAPLNNDEIKKLIPVLLPAVKRKVYSMPEWKEAEKTSEEGETKHTHRFKASFKGRNYEYQVELEHPSSLHNKIEPNKFSVTRSWTDLDLGEHGRIDISEKVFIVDSDKEPILEYTWQRSDKPNETLIYKNDLKAFRSIQGFIST